jgi:hypothetical protein
LTEFIVSDIPAWVTKFKVGIVIAFPFRDERMPDQSCVPWATSEMMKQPPPPPDSVERDQLWVNFLLGGDFAQRSRANGSTRVGVKNVKGLCEGVSVAQGESSH